MVNNNDKSIFLTASKFRKLLIYEFFVNLDANGGQ